VPHTLVLLFGIMVLAWLATWLLPQGAFETRRRAGPDAGGARHLHAGRGARRLAPWELLTAVPRAMADAQAIIFFLLIVGGAIAVLRATGTIDALLGWILRRIGHSPGAADHHRHGGLRDRLLDARRVHRVHPVRRGARRALPGDAAWTR
jgi:uncharacterized ion transporter superfamily protein YfcC